MVVVVDQRCEASSRNFSACSGDVWQLDKIIHAGTTIITRQQCLLVRRLQGHWLNACGMSNYRIVLYDQFEHLQALPDKGREDIDEERGFANWIKTSSCCGEEL
jgi:hypothetical protein